MEHLTFDEIVKAVFADENTPDNMRLIARMNAHVIQCKECNKVYNAVYDIYELGFEQGLEVVEQRLKEAESSFSQRNVLTDQDLLSSIVLSIKKGTKLVLDSIKNNIGIDYFFSYPMALATRGGNQKMETNKLIDDENLDNQIVLNDGKLSLYLCREDFSVRGINSLYMECREGNRILFSGPMEVYENTFQKSVDVGNDDTLCIKLWGNHVQQT